jgi:hypothetical protein
MDDIDTVTGGEDLTIDQAAAAYAKVTAPNEADTGQSEDDETTQSDDTTDDELQASAEDEGEETDGEDDPESQPEDDEEGEEPDSEKGRYVAHNGRVKLPDGSESTIADLIAGNMKERDYRQKTMEAAEVKKTYEAQSSALKASQQQIAERSEFMAALIQSIVGEAPDLALFDTDPREYISRKETREQWINHLNAIQSQMQQDYQSRQQETERQMTDKANQEWDALLGAVPAFKDEKRFSAFAQDVNKYGAEAYKFTPQELAALRFDHRQALVMKDAIAWRKLQASKPAVQKKVEGRPPVAKGGKRLSPTEQRARGAHDAMTRLQQSGSERDAIAAYLALQPKG